MTDTDELPPELLRVELDGHAWAIDPRALPAITGLLTGEIRAGTRADGDVEARRRGREAPRHAGGVAVVGLKGVLMPVGGLLALLFGIEDPVTTFAAELDDAASDPDVAAIVLDVDSPGGLVDRIPETAARVRDVRSRKPVVAVANTQMASAAYWIASQADEISVTPSGEAGSIGVYLLHQDLSGAYAQEGIVPTVISAGKYKVEGHPWGPLEDEARAQWQSEVDDYYGQFCADVAKGRHATPGDVRAGYGEGRCLHARQAVSARIADRVETLSDAVRRVGSHAGRAALDRRRESAVDEPPEELGPAADDPPAVTYTPEERTRLLTVLSA